MNNFKTTLQSSSVPAIEKLNVFFSLPALQSMLLRPMWRAAIATGFALFVVFFPWELISRGGFPDFETYVYNLTYFDSAGLSFQEVYNSPSFIAYFTGEFLWFFLTQSLTHATGSAVFALRLCSFFVVFYSCWFLSKRIGYTFIPLFLLNPLTIDVTMSGIRNGLAWSLFIIGVNTQSRTIRLSLFLCGSLIHTSTLLLVCFYYILRSTMPYLDGKKLLLVGIGSSVLLGLFVTIGGEIIATATGDRRLGSDYVVGGGSLLQPLPWAALLFFQCLSGRQYIRDHIFIISIISFYLVVNLTIPHAYRIIGAIMPLIALSALSLEASKRVAFFMLYVGYTMIHYYYWTKLFL